MSLDADDFLLQVALLWLYTGSI